MKIRYTLIIAILAAALGYGCAPSIAHPENTVAQECNPDHGCIDFDAHPELIGGGIVYE